MYNKIYNKLVRDKIPEIIKSNGGIATTRVLTREEYTEKLKEKLVEEVQEFLSSESEEELVDIFQVISAILDEREITLSEFKKMCQQKAVEKGEFKERLFLICVDE